MKIEDAAKLLGDRYRAAMHGDKVSAIHVFGIEFADEIKDIPKAELASRAGLSSKYGTELSKAVRLAKFVRLR